MAHDEDRGGLGDQLRQGACHDTGLDLGAPLGLPGPAAVEGEVVAVLDHSLVAAAAEAHFHTQGGELIVLLEALAVLAYADGDGGRGAGVVGDGMDGVQDGKLFVDKMGQFPLLEQEQVTVPLQLPDNAAAHGGPAGDGVVQPGGKAGDGFIRQVGGQLVVVVHQDDAHHGPGQLVFLLDVQQLRQVHKVEHGGLIGRSVDLGADQVSVDPVVAPAPGDRLGALGLAIQNPVGGQLREDLGQTLLKEADLGVCDLHKRFVAPHDLAVGEIEDHGRKGNTHFLIGNGVHGEVYILQIFIDILLAQGRPNAVIDKQAQGRRSLQACGHAGQEKPGHCAHQGQHYKIDAEPRGEEAGGFFVH